MVRNAFTHINDFVFLFLFLNEICTTTIQCLRIDIADTMSVDFIIVVVVVAAAQAAYCRIYTIKIKVKYKIKIRFFEMNWIDRLHFHLNVLTLPCWLTKSKWTVVAQRPSLTFNILEMENDLFFSLSFILSLQIVCKSFVSSSCM